jgi:hypothetical protein
MKTQTSAITTWQGWLDAFVHDATPEGWAAFMQLNEDGANPPEPWAAMFSLNTQYHIARAMLLACLQLPTVEAEAALAAIAGAAHRARFGKPPRNLKPQLKEVYRYASKTLLRDYPSEADLLQAVFLHYLRDDYDAQADANLLLREAHAQATFNKRAQALDLAGRAGAAAIRGRPLWSGWVNEGSGEFQHWALLLTTIFGDWTADRILPLAAACDERARASERAEMLSLAAAHDVSEPDAAEPAPQAVELSEAFVHDWVELSNRGNPLNAAEIKDLGERYGQYAEAALRTLEMGGERMDDAPVDTVVRLAASTIGVLRYTDENAIERLIEVVRDVEELYDDPTIENALWSLEQLGTAALPQVFDFVRYSSDDGARGDLMEVLGIIGRGSAEVFDYVSRQFLDILWENGKAGYARPLGLLHDARAIPMLAAALADPAVDDEDAWDLLDALEELGVPFTVERDRRAVSIPGHDVIEEVVPDDWVPRSEIEPLEEDELADDEPDSGGWGRDKDDEVVYDAYGIARCADCGAIMRRVSGRWEHPYADEFPAAQQPRVRGEAVGRNDPCPCGSGKKYKACHGKLTSTILN